MKEIAYCMTEHPSLWELEGPRTRAFHKLLLQLIALRSIKKVTMLQLQELSRLIDRLLCGRSQFSLGHLWCSCLQCLQRMLPRAAAVTDTQEHVPRKLDVAQTANHIISSSHVAGVLQQCQERCTHLAVLLYFTFLSLIMSGSLQLCYFYMPTFLCSDYYCNLSKLYFL